MTRAINTKVGLVVLATTLALGCGPGTDPKAELAADADDMAVSDKDLEKDQDQRQVQVALTLNVSGQGAVVVDPLGQRCNTSCRLDAAEGTQLVLSVEPQIKNSFSGWGGECKGNAGSCTFTIKKDTVVSATFAQKTCEPSDWCKESSGVTDALYGVYAQGPRNVLVVGENGTVLQFDGGSFGKLKSGVTKTLRSVWAASAQEAWMVGDGGTILRYDRGLISPVPSPVGTQLNGVFGVSTSEIYMVGVSGVILRYDGRTVTQMATGVTVDLLSVWAASANNAWASTLDYSQSVGMYVGYSLLRYDGTVWKRSLQVPAKTTILMSAIHGNASDGVWLVGDGSGSGAYPTSCMWYRPNGMGGHSLGYTTLGCQRLHAVWVGSQSDVWIAGVSGVLKHWNGSAFDGQHPFYNIGSGTQATLQGIHGLSEKNVWSVGQGGTILHLEK